MIKRTEFHCPRIYLQSSFKKFFLDVFDLSIEVRISKPEFGSKQIQKLAGSGKLDWLSSLARLETSLPLYKVVLKQDDVKGGASCFCRNIHKRLKEIS